MTLGGINRYRPRRCQAARDSDARPPIDAKMPGQDRVVAVCVKPPPRLCLRHHTSQCDETLAGRAATYLILADVAGQVEILPAAHGTSAVLPLGNSRA